MKIPKKCHNHKAQPFRRDLDALRYNSNMTLTFAFCPCEKLLSHMTTLVLGIIHLKVGEKEAIVSQSMQDREISPSASLVPVEIPTPRVRFTYPAGTLMIDSYIPKAPYEKVYMIKLQ